MNWSKIFNIRQGIFSSDFRLVNPLDNSRGDTYTDLQQSWTNLIQHESIFEIIDTVNHEAIHVALRREENSDEIEHVMMRYLNRVYYGLIDLDD